MPVIHLRSLPPRTTKSDLLALLDRVGGLDRRRVGRLDLQGSEATIEVPEGWQVRLAKSLDGQTLNHRRITAWAESPTHQESSSEDHFQRLLRLLEVESTEEAQQAAQRARQLGPADAERSGISLIDLVVRDEQTALGGRYLVRLAKSGGSPLPWTRLGVGSPVTLSPHAAGSRGNRSAYRAVICDRKDATIEVALGSVPDQWDSEVRWRLDLTYDEVAIDRQRQALHQVRSARGDRVAVLRDILLGQRSPAFNPLQDDPLLDLHLNEVQQDAVRFALAARDVALIHGPPGTGKTTAIVELIRRSIRRGDKVLATAPSNTAVDNLLARCLSWGVNAVRLGHPGRVMPGLRAHTLDLLVDDHPDVRLARKLVKDALGLFRKADRYTRARPEANARRDARQEAKSLLADARRLQDQAAQNILDQAEVVCATTTGLDSGLLGPRRFDLAVIDEACQSTEPGCWIPLLRADRVVLAGDHCQLPPTVVSRQAADEGFGKSLFERLIDLTGAQIARRLTVQYRMHESIMDFSSLEFYDAELAADPSVARHVLADLEGVAAIPLTQIPLDFIDTAGASFDEELEPDGESRLNRGEAALVAHKVRELLDAGVPAGEIGVITPYAAQVRLLREQLPQPELEIDSVDGFQGREKEAIVISLVRSNPDSQIGFLSDVRRMNVALTRARRKLLVIGDTATLSTDPFYRRMIEYFESLSAYRTVWEENADLPIP